MAARRDLYIPYKRNEPLDGRPVGTRLGHEHDMNDAFWTRMDDHQKFEAWKKALEKKDDRKWFHHAINFFIWGTLYVIFVISVGKVTGVL